MHIVSRFGLFLRAEYDAEHGIILWQSESVYARARVHLSVYVGRVNNE